MLTTLLTRRPKVCRFLAYALLLQAGGCMFDQELFVSTALGEVINNTSALFFGTIFSELLKVSPGF